MTDHSMLELEPSTSSMADQASKEQENASRWMDDQDDVELLSEQNLEKTNYGRSHTSADQVNAAQTAALVEALSPAVVDHQTSGLSESAAGILDEENHLSWLPSNDPGEDWMATWLSADVNRTGWLGGVENSTRWVDASEEDHDSSSISYQAAELFKTHPQLGEHHQQSSQEPDGHSAHHAAEKVDLQLQPALNNPQHPLVPVN